MNDAEGLGAKLEAGDKKTLLAEIKKAQDWLESEGTTASTEELDEKKEEFVPSLVANFRCETQCLYLQIPSSNRTYYCESIWRWRW